jgi:diguanylate cyclase
VGAEALVRWERQGRVLGAPEFVHLAEDAGLMVPLEAWVLDAACRQVKAWQSLGPTDLRVAVNISARHFEDPNLRRTIERALVGADLVPDRLELELTETALMRDAHGAQAALGELKLLGVRISIDDFGTGYSSLSHLRRLPVNSIKIDRTFIRTLTSNRLDGAIVRAVITLAHELGIEVVAEGVETRRQLDFLEDAGCDLAQGFLFSPPVSPQEFQGLVAARLPRAEA